MGKDDELQRAALLRRSRVSVQPRPRLSTLRRASRAVLLADGAMGTELIARRGVKTPAELNLTEPNVVLDLHRQYLAAGAQLLVANTLMANPTSAVAGVRLAREAAGEHMVAGSLAAVPGRSRGSYRELERALTEADVLLIETVTSVQALDAALNAIERRPVWVTLSFDAAGLIDGRRPRDVARQLLELGVDTFGYGCGFGVAAAGPVLAELRDAAPNATLIAKPSVSIEPVEMAAWARDTASLGVDIIGACCGSTPAHILAMALAILPT